MGVYPKLIMNPRIIIEGEVEGYRVKVFIGDDDLQLDESGQLPGLDIDPAIIPSFVSDIRDLGVQSPFKRASSQDLAKAANPMETKSWSCPVHGDQYIYPSRFDPKKKVCAKYEVATGLEAPDWAKSKLSDVRGQPRWYCKHSES